MMLIRAAAIAVVVGSGCGDFVESDGTLAMATLDARGGTLAYQRMTLVVPAGAISQAITLRASVRPTARALADAYHVEPDGRRFTAPLQVSISLEGLPLPMATELFLADFSHEPPQPLAGRRVDATQISGTTTVTGLFGLLRCSAGVCPH